MTLYTYAIKVTKKTVGHWLKVAQAHNDSDIRGQKLRLHSVVDFTKYSRTKKHRGIFLVFCNNGGVSETDVFFHKIKDGNVLILPLDVTIPTGFKKCLVDKETRLFDNQEEVDDLNTFLERIQLAIENAPQLPPFVAKKQGSNLKKLIARAARYDIEIYSSDDEATINMKMKYVEHMEEAKAMWGC